MFADLLRSLREIAEWLTTVAYVASGLGMILVAIMILLGVRMAAQRIGGVVAGCFLASIAPGLVRFLGGVLPVLVAGFLLLAPSIAEAQSAPPPPPGGSGPGWCSSSGGNAVVRRIRQAACSLAGPASVAGVHGAGGYAAIATGEFSAWLLSGQCPFCAAIERASSVLLTAAREVGALLLDPALLVASAIAAIPGLIESGTAWVLSFLPRPVEVVGRAAELLGIDPMILSAAAMVTFSRQATGRVSWWCVDDARVRDPFGEVQWGLFDPGRRLVGPPVPASPPRHLWRHILPGVFAVTSSPLALEVSL